MDIIDLSLGLNTSRAERELRRLDALGNQLFSKRGFKINVATSGLPLGRIIGDFDNFRSSLDAATARVAAFTATTGIVYGLADAFRRLFTESITLEKQLATIQSILRASSSEMAKLSDSLLLVANNTSQSFNAAVEAATEFSRQGLTLNKTIEATTAALSLSKIAGIDAASAVQSLTSTMNTFAQEGLTYQKVLDTIVSLDNNFAASAAGIADGLKRVGSVASEAGVELKEVASLITVVQQVSARGEAVISNGLKTIFTRLSRTSVQERLQEIGIATKDATGAFRPFIDILTDLANAQDKLSDSQKALVNETVAGGYQINTLQSVLKTLRGEYSLFDRALQVAGNSAGDTAARLRVLNDTASSSLQVLQNNLARTFATIGSKTVLPLLKDFTTTVNGILESFNSNKFESSFGEIDSRSIGEKFATGFIDGFSSFLGSSGLSILAVVLSRLLAKVTQDLGKGLFNLAASNKGVQVNADLQRTVNTAILNGNQALVQRLATTDSLITKNQILNQLLERQNQIGNLNLTNVLVSRGLKNANIKTKAKGFIPAILKEKKDILSGVGGASRNAEPLIREVDLGKGREKVVVNSEELLVKNYLNSGKDAIFNQDMIRDAGGIEALKKMGRVKRFASGSVYDQIKNTYSKEEELFRKSNSNGNFATTQRGKELRQALARSLSGTLDQSTVKGLLSNSPLAKTKPLIDDLSALPGTRATKSFSSSSGFSDISKTGTSQEFETNKKQDQKDLRQYKDLNKLRKLELKVETENIKLKQSQQEFLEKAEKEQRKLTRKDAAGRIGLGVSIATPFLTAGIASSLGVSSRENSGAGRTVRGAEALGSGLAVAAAFGFNPIAIAAGGLVTTLSFLQKEAQATIPSFEDLKKSADKIISANQTQDNAVQNAIQSQNLLTELNSKGASIQERAKTRESIINSASQIQDKKIVSLLISGNNSKKSQEAIDRFQLGLQQSSRAQESLLFARKKIEESQLKSSSFSNFIFGGEKASERNLNTDDFDAFLAPLIDSVDSVALSSDKASLRLEQLNKGTINGADFFAALGEDLLLLESTAKGASKEFQGFIDSFSQESISALEKYTVAQFKYKQSLLELSKVYTEAETVSVNFKRAFDLSIKNLANKFDFESFSDSVSSKSATSINKQIFEAQRELGQISEQEFIRNSSATSRVENEVDFADKSNRVFQEAVSPLVEQLSKSTLSPDKQGEIIGKISSLFSGRTSFTDLENTIKQVLGTNVESADLLASVSKTSEQVGKDIAKLVHETETSNNEIITLEKLQLAKLNKGPNIEDILSGKTGESRSKLLNKTVDLDLTKKISDLTKKIAVVGPSSKKGIELTDQVNSLKARQLSLRKQDFEARKALVPSSNIRISDDVKKQEAELLASDFYKTNAELLKQALDEINVISTKKFGGKKFSEEIVRQLTSDLSLGKTSNVLSSLGGISATTTNPQIKGLLDNIFSSGVLSGFQPVQLPSLQKVNIPKQVDFTTEVERFKDSLNNFLSTDSFTKNKTELSNISNAQSKTRGAADALAVSLGQLADLDKAVEKNRQILEKNEAIRNILGKDLVDRIKSGGFTSENLSSVSETRKSIIKANDIVLPQKTKTVLQDQINEQNNNLRTLLEEQKNIEKSSADSLKELNEKISRLLEVQKGDTVSDTGAQSRIEQAISLAVDVRGVDNKLATDIKGALTNVIDTRIKEVIKDTFNVAAITKPTTSVA